MSIRPYIRAVCDQRGTALPMAMLALLILSVLVIGFSVLSSSEPTIANNQLRVEQARAVAEAGVERAMWALSHPTNASGIPDAFVTAPAPYDKSQLITICRPNAPVDSLHLACNVGATNGSTLGGFRVTVVGSATPGPWPAGCPGALTSRERCIVSVGWVPNDTTTPRTTQKIAVVVSNPAFAFRDVPAALSVRGELQMGGNSLVDSTGPQTDLTCGNKAGTLSLGLTDLNGNATEVYGATDNNNTRNEATDILQNVDPSIFAPNNSFLLTDSEIDSLRTYAKAHGTYYQGAKTFTSGNLPNGVVFIDTTTGTNITQEGVTPATLASTFADVDVHGNAPAGLNGDGIFHGWLFVNGTARISGNFEMKGVVYSQNDLVYQGTGTGKVSGAMVSRNIRDTSSTSIDSEAGGQSKILYNCDDAKRGGGGGVPSWVLKGGTYKELAGS
jgi:hypothetical protein